MTWFVMRDLTRPNALHPAYMRLADAGFEIFTPMTWKIRRRGSKTERVKAPVIHDLLFVKSTRQQLDPVVEEISTLQYRFVRGGRQGESMTVPEAEMERFITAVASDSNPKFYLPGEITAAMVGKRVRILSGPLSGFEGNLIKIRGLRSKRLIVELPGMLSSTVEVTGDMVELVADRKDKK